MPNVFRKDYFEATIQLRPKKKEILDFIKERIEKRKDVFISKIVEKKYGVDLYISSNKFALSLAKLLKKRFNGEIITSRSLHSRHKQTGKLLYRVTVCFRSKEEGL